MEASLVFSLLKLSVPLPINRVRNSASAHNWGRVEPDRWVETAGTESFLHRVGCRSRNCSWERSQHCIFLRVGESNREVKEIENCCLY